MKRHSILFLLPLFILTGCFDDDSTLPTAEVSDITVKFPQSLYSANAFIDTLIIPPDVTSAYAEDDLEYTWYIYDEAKIQEDIYNNQEPDTMEIIGRQKVLQYVSNRTPGMYTLALKVASKSNGYAVMETTSLNVSTLFTDGFYILKETAEGNTELDLSISEEQLETDLLARTQGSALPGKPRSLSALFSTMCYVDPVTDEPNRGTAIAVTTENNEVGIYRTMDLKAVADRSNLLMETTPADEKPYGFYQGYLYTFYMSASGMRVASNSKTSSTGTGRFGPLLDGSGETGGSPHCAFYGTYNKMIYWDNKAKGLIELNSYGHSSKVNPPEGKQWSDYECLKCGVSGFGDETDASTLYFLLKNTGNEKVYLCFLRISSQPAAVREFTELSPDSHFAKGEVRSICAKTAKVFYVVDEGKLWRHNWDNHAESEIMLTGLSEGASLDYVSNQFYSAGRYTSFDYLVVGVQRGGNYTLLFYRMQGGEPQEIVRTVCGVGKVKSVRFTTNDFKSDSFDYSSCIFGYPCVD